MTVPQRSTPLKHRLPFPHGRQALVRIPRGKQLRQAIEHQLPGFRCRAFPSFIDQPLGQAERDRRIGPNPPQCAHQSRIALGVGPLGQQVRDGVALERVLRARMSGDDGGREVGRPATIAARAAS